MSPDFVRLLATGIGFGLLVLLFLRVAFGPARAAALAIIAGLKARRLLGFAPRCSSLHAVQEAVTAMIAKGEVTA